MSPQMQEGKVLWVAPTMERFVRRIGDEPFLSKYSVALLKGSQAVCDMYELCW